MKRIAPLLLGLLMLAGCGLTDAAKLMKSYRISLSAYQDAEISAFQAGAISAAAHQHDQADIEKLANYGIIGDKALLASDKAGVTTQVSAALAAVQEIEANDITSIGDTTKRGAVELAVAGLQNLLSQVSLALGVKQ